MANVSSLLTSLAGPIAKKALAALGMGVLSYAAVQAAFAGVQAALLASYGQISADIVGPLNMAGFGQAIGIVLGAMSARFSLLAVKKIGMMSA
jgi:hypothetical protein